MNKGVVIFAHNSRDVDYALMALISGGLAKKNLNVPVSLITDKFTIDWMKESKMYSKAVKIFDKIIKVKLPSTDNSRRLNDGTDFKEVPFINSNRPNVWDLTPYDKTLLIDSDFLIFTDNLNQFWDVDESVMIAPSMTDIRGDRIGTLDKWVSDEGVPLYWATTVLFTKNEESELFFKLVDHIKNNYTLYSELYRYNPAIYRNDISFSVAKHIMDGFATKSINLPSVLTAQDKDLVHSVTDTGVRVLVSDPLDEGKMTICKVSNRDIHIMNKQAIVRLASNFMELI